MKNRIRIIVNLIAVITLFNPYVINCQFYNLNFEDWSVDSGSAYQAPPGWLRYGLHVWRDTCHSEGDYSVAVESYIFEEFGYMQTFIWQRRRIDNVPEKMFFDYKCNKGKCRIYVKFFDTVDGEFEEIIWEETNFVDTFQMGEIDFSNIVHPYDSIELYIAPIWGNGSYYSIMNVDNIRFSYDLSETSSQDLKEVKVYPNPCKDYIWVAHPQKESRVTIDIFGVLDNQIKIREKSHADGDRIDLSNLGTGLFVLVIKDKNNEIIGFEKVIKAE